MLSLLCDLLGVKIHLIGAEITEMLNFTSCWGRAIINILLLVALPVEAKKLVKHDASFIPDVVLRVSLETIQLNCQPRLSTLINGTYPAPPIYLEPEQTTWIRVFNDADVNTTMVSRRRSRSYE